MRWVHICHCDLSWAYFQTTVTDPNRSQPQTHNKKTGMIVDSYATVIWQTTTTVRLQGSRLCFALHWLKWTNDNTLRTAIYPSIDKSMPDIAVWFLQIRCYTYELFYLECRQHFVRLLVGTGGDRVSGVAVRVNDRVASLPADDDGPFSPGCAVQLL